VTLRILGNNSKGHRQISFHCLSLSPLSYSDLMMILNRSQRIRWSTLVPSAWRSSANVPVYATGSVESCQRCFSSLDGANRSGSVEFSTLYELQSSACSMFAQRNLFGTYQPKKQAFEFMSYGDFAREVDRCRIVLRNMGEILFFPRHSDLD